MTTKPKILERVVKARIKTVLDRLGADCWYFMPSMNGYGRAGIPDFVGVYKGRGFAIEAKGPDGAPTTTQRHELACIADAHGVALLIGPDNIGDIEPALSGHITYHAIH